MNLDSEGKISNIDWVGRTGQFKGGLLLVAAALAASRAIAGEERARQ